MATESKEAFFRWLFLIAAAYDFVLGVIFFFGYRSIYALFHIDLPNYPMYLQMAVAFIIAMGVGYYFVYRNMYRNIDLVKLGIVYKGVYSGLVGYFYFANLANILFFYFAVIDFIFLVLFVLFLMHAKKDGRYKKWA